MELLIKKRVLHTLIDASRETVKYDWPILDPSWCAGDELLIKEAHPNHWGLLCFSIRDRSKFTGYLGRVLGKSLT